MWAHVYFDAMVAKLFQYVRYCLIIPSPEDKRPILL
jgi:hypothetical protein